MKRFTILFAASTLALSLAAHADTRMTFASGNGEASQFAIKGDRIRMEGGSNGGVVTLFDAGSGRMTVIEPFKKRYYHMDPETLKRQSRRMSDQMRQMREQMEKQLQNMPEEQREMMRKQMERMMPEQQAPADEPADVRIERSGKKARIAGVECERVTVYADGAPAQRVCVASAADLDMPASDLSTLRSLFDLLNDMATGLGPGRIAAQAPARVIEELDGLPIEAHDLQGDKTWTLQNVRTGPIDAGDFEIPSAYHEVDPFAAGQ